MRVNSCLHSSAFSLFRGEREPIILEVGATKGDEEQYKLAEKATRMTST